LAINIRTSRVGISVSSYTATIVYGHYRIAYELASAKEIYILGVFHGAMDIEHYLS